MTMITAHSGSDNTEENSWAFLRFCLDRQLCFEVDVRQQTDGTLILAHDRQEVVPDSVTLEQVFQAVANEKATMTINCDLKEEGLKWPFFRWHKPIKSGHKLFLVAMYNYLGPRFGESIYFIILKISSKGKNLGILPKQI
ncbi:hypothetical protein LOS25_15065 [Enterococcus faecium]|nr:hypothetical protein [Enterococcus faecium]